MKSNFPSGWHAHGRHKLPAHLIGGAIPRTAGVHYIVTTANPATTAATVAAIAVAKASSGLADARLPTRRSDDSRRALTGFLGGPYDVSPVGIIIINTRPEVPVASAVPAAALVASARRQLDVAWTTRTQGIEIADFDKIRRSVSEFEAPLGLIIIAKNFTGAREDDSAPHQMLTAMASTFGVPVLIVTNAMPACPNPDAVLFGLTDSQLSCDNPASGQPFAVSLTREEVVIDGDTVMTTTLGPRRAWAPAAKPKAQVAASPVGRPKRREATTIYLLPISSNRELTPDERDLLGGLAWTIDRATALKIAAQTPGPTTISVVNAPDRDAAGDNANANISWLRAEIHHQGLDSKIEAERASFGINWRGPDRNIAA